MSRIYRLSKTGLKLLYKIRHHKGHGIHSPFVFNLITKVIEEKTPYYVYEDIESFIAAKNVAVELKKYNYLLFRLVNYFGAKQLLEIGSGQGVNTLFLTAASKDTKCICVEEDEDKISLAQNLCSDWDRCITFSREVPVIDSNQDCIFIDLENFSSITPADIQYIVGFVHEKSFIIMNGIRTNRHNYALWRSLLSENSRTAALDLFNMGIVFFDRSLYRWNYQISF